jgi:Spy/CpxP family protein refolding chaperone
MRTRWLWIALLLSLGLNVGLGWNLLQRAPGPEGPFAPDAPRSGRDAGSGPALAPPTDPEQQTALLRHRLDRLTRRLGLTTGQRDALWEVHQRSGAEVFARRRALEDARGRMHALLGEPEADPRGLQAARREISTLQAELDSLVLGIMVEERSVLTPEQARRYRGLFPFGHHDGPRQGPGQRGPGRRWREGG